MKDKIKTKAQLIEEMAELRHRLSCLEMTESGRGGAAELERLLEERTSGLEKETRQLRSELAERRQVEKKLREGEERYRSIVENIQEAYYEVDLAGNLVFFNRSHCEMLGYTKEEMMGMNYRRYVTDEEIGKAAFQVVNEVYRTGISIRYIDWELKKKDGTKIFVETSVSLIRDSLGTPIGFRGVSRDITEHKRMEDALRESEGRYRNILENIQEGYYESDLVGNYTFFNRAYCDLLGSTEEKMKGTNFRQHVDENALMTIFNDSKEVYRTGIPQKNVEWKLIRKDGTTIFAEASVVLVRDSSGKPVGFRGMIRDITEHKRMEEALRQSEGKYRNILENIQEGYYEVDLAGNLTFFNSAFPQSIGYTEEEMKGTNFRQHVDENALMTILHHSKEVYRTGMPTHTDWELNKKDGTKMFVETSVSLIRDSSGKPTGFRGVTRDVTEQKRIENALRQSEERYRNILESIQEGYYEVDLAGRYIFFNPSYCRLLASTEEEMKGTNFRQHVDKNAVGTIIGHSKDVYHSGIPLEHADWEIITKDGQKKFLEASVSLIKDSSGKPTGFRGMVRDATERKRMEDALRVNEEKYRNILESIQEGYYEMDLVGNLTFVNTPFSRIIGYAGEEIRGTNYQRYVAAEEEAKTIIRYSKGVYKTGIPAYVHTEFRKKDGSTIFVETSVSLMRDSSGKSVGFRGMIRDISERKRMENALRQSEERYRNILESIQEGYYEVDLAGNFTFFNSSLPRILGYTEEEMRRANFRRFTNRDHAKEVFHIYREVHRTGLPTQADWELKKKDGSTIFVETSVSLIRDSLGNPVGFRGMVHDATERRRMEEEIRILAITDPLTGLYNRRGFLALAEQQMKVSERIKRGVLLFYADLDGMKDINDTLGHTKGDEALIETTHVLKEVFRESDLIARIGGDEFTVLAMETSEVPSHILANRLQQCIDTHNARENRDYTISLSIGIVRSDLESPSTIHELISRADTLMYEHKKSKQA